ncbi:phosphodiester glycosidase family protein [Clostridium omnivorum]|uniref:Exopolysaccharide biosynthesis protein n=1 Tax=Clostridium omnivorum TaxID=1604902 RepID=A0ABQ5N8G6_9CLOT|nr:phosphodiester glycosidase family protein [Clostridium sp. E14]GLC31447.1 exopolysaccharide biosynthesis protein [Clostridium sp. E14]
MIVTSAMTTMRHQYIAKAFLSEKEINEIMDKNKVDTTDKYSDEKAIEVAKYNDSEAFKNGDIQYNDNKGVPKEKDNIEMVDISNGKYKGYLLIVSNPDRVSVATTKKVGNYGMKLEDIVKEYDAVGGINAGGFADENGKGNGGTPIGLLIEDGQVIYGNEKDRYDIVGLNEDSVLVLGSYTLKELKAKKIRDAVTFSPFLVVNGQPTIKQGNGGWGIAPRTAIGQRKDGTILMLVIDGRQVSSIGATLKEVQDIMLQYDAYNAANLDGGASTTMIYENKTINHPCSQYGPRYLPSAFIIKKN